MPNKMKGKEGIGDGEGVLGNRKWEMGLGRIGKYYKRWSWARP